MSINISVKIRTFITKLFNDMWEIACECEDIKKLDFQSASIAFQKDEAKLMQPHNGQQEMQRMELVSPSWTYFFPFEQACLLKDSTYFHQSSRVQDSGFLSTLLPCFLISHNPQKSNLSEAHHRVKNAISPTKMQYKVGFYLSVMTLRWNSICDPNISMINSNQPGEPKCHTVR